MRLQQAILALVITSGLLAGPGVGQAAEAGPPPGPRSEFCVANPDQCQQQREAMQQRRAERQEYCKANPQQCEQQRQQMQAKCAADPAKCEQMKQEMRTRREEMRARCQADPASCEAMKAEARGKMGNRPAAPPVN
jgi:hypothetical protein